MNKRLSPIHLGDYQTFHNDVIESTEEQVEYIRSFDTHFEFLETLGAPADNLVVSDDAYGRAEVLHIPARSGDRKGAVLVGLAMANPLDGGQRFQTGALAVMAPDYDVIAFGNPSGGLFDSGRLSKQARKQVTEGNARPLIDPALKYLDEQGYDELIAYGYSYGAELAAEAARYADQEVSGLITVDSASARKQLVLAKGLIFITTGFAFPNYVSESEMEAFTTARADSLKSGDFNKGIFTADNLAIGRYIARGAHAEKLAAALEAQPESVHTGYWGAKSEFQNGRYMEPIYEDLAERFPNRVYGHAMAGQKHAFANHIPTQMAMFAQGMKNAA